MFSFQETLENEKGRKSGRGDDGEIAVLGQEGGELVSDDFFGFPHDSVDEFFGCWNIIDYSLHLTGEHWRVFNLAAHVRVCPRNIG